MVLKHVIRYFICQVRKTYLLNDFYKIPISVYIEFCYLLDISKFTEATSETIFRMYLCTNALGKRQVKNYLISKY